MVICHLCDMALYLSILHRFSYGSVVYVPLHRSRLVKTCLLFLLYLQLFLQQKSSQNLHASFCNNGSALSNERLFIFGVNTFNSCIIAFSISRFVILSSLHFLYFSATSIPLPENAICIELPDLLSVFSACSKTPDI